MGSYAKRITNGEYAVYKIVDTNGEVSTLGISNPFARYRMDQHHHEFNRPVDSVTRSIFAAKITKEVRALLEKHKPFVEDSGVSIPVRYAHAVGANF